MSERKKEGEKVNSAAGGTSGSVRKRTSLCSTSVATRSVRSVVLPGAQAARSPSEEGSRSRVSKAWVAMDVRMRFTLIDTFVSFFVLTPLVIIYWLGVYGLLERVFPTWLGTEWGPWGMLLIGIYVETAVCFLQKDLEERLPCSGSSEFYSHFFTTRLFNLVLSVANIAHYRALEILYQEQVNFNLTIAVQTAVTSTLILWSLKCGRNILGPPLCVEVDTEVDNIYHTSTRFKTTPGKSIAHLLDALVSVSLVTSLIHTHWISITSVFDYTLYPDNVGLSLVTSGAVGYGVVFFFILAQGPARRLSSYLEKKSSVAKILFEDFYFACANIGVILVWRGLGMFFDALCRSFPVILQGNDVTWIVAMFVPFVLLMLAHSCGTLVTKGYDVDGDFQDGTGIDFCISYFGGFFADEIQEHLKEEQDKKNKNEQKKFR